MASLIDKLISKAQKLFDRFSGTSLSQESIVPEGERYVTPGLPNLIRQAGADGCVLLKNDGVLPLKSSDKVAIFGRCQIDYFYVGYGSGGDVKPPYKISFLQAMQEGEKQGKFSLDNTLADRYAQWCSRKENLPFDGWWGHWPMNYPEMPLDKIIVEESAKKSNAAIIVIGRAAGEDRENILEKGSYYLTDEERNMLDLVTSAFNKVVVIMDCGNLMDMAWTEEYGDKLSAILFAWQGGMESGHSLADILSGDVNPSGKLPDTIARRFEDYPSSSCFGNKEFNEYREDIFVGYRYFETFAKDKVLYPFGYGLSYTNFDISLKDFIADNGKFKCVVEVRNIGEVAGREVTQFYVSCPQGKLGKPSRVLVGFKKTGELQPNESEILEIICYEYDFASYDDTGATGNVNCYVLESGKYEFFVGNSVKTDLLAGVIHLDKDKVLKNLQEICSVQNAFDRYKAIEKDGRISLEIEKISLGNVDMKARILQGLPKTVGYKGNQGYTFDDLRQGAVDMDTFVSQLTDKELEALTRGAGGMNAPQGVIGNAGAYGGIIPSLADKKIPAVITTDGPSGIRIGKYTALMPCGTALASTWDVDLIRGLYEKVGEEMAYYGSDVLLGAGMNIHRNPLCGRNFEYFSEDPLLSGKMACAFVDGVQKKGRAACPKHFACNNQETNRNYNDSRVSQRALREIYLKGFEICVKESKPLNIMTSYNKINSVWSHYNYDLTTTVLRDEWGYDGLVITDWWLRKSKSPEFPNIKTHAYRVRAGVDVFMPGNHSRTSGKYKSDGTLLATLNKKDGITRGELERTAKRTLNICLKISNAKQTR
ncbi:MAG: glycoside hydrolase family 3 C-terminal domain-containing protein [Clostridia bacterium]|nr:glycoside hydrolase family 3 C-terminal domain-containing protein [Clostridia bacterium]